MCLPVTGTGHLANLTLLNKSLHTKLTLEKKILPPLLPDRAKIQQAIGQLEDLLTIVKRRKLQWCIGKADSRLADNR